MKKTLSTILIALVLNVASGVSVYAAENTTREKQSIASSNESNAAGVRDEKAGQTPASKEKADFYKNIRLNDSGFDFAKSEKSTLADYEKSKAAGKKFSTTKKVLIGAGIAAAAIGIFVLAASRDKVEPFK